ncbi:MAG: ABC transporter permease [Oscillospiraceae bacterium]|nr:ABC transporter permease [Oscillospiraceae bacterium]MDD7429903.1 ABC transporter permease [Oscillospiraceae bacterium]MDY2846772.1 ABC transporter permease [Oscillospiraceae bacterium]
MGAIFRREIKAYFTSPIAYIFIAVFYVYTGMYFVGTNIYSATTDMTYVFSGVFTLMMIMLPLLTMRLMSEEKKQKTDQCLLTAPVNLAAIVMGKFFAALCVFLIGMAIYIPYILVLYKLAGSIAWATVIGNMFALLLLGASFISIGMLISSLTENQIVAAIASFIVIMLFYMIDVLAASVSVDWLKNVMVSLGFYNRYYEFTNGIINIPSIVFFLSVTFICNFLTVRVLEKRRWG